MPNYLLTIIGISIIFIATTLGSALVFFFKKQEITPKLNRIFLGFAAGVMLSAAVFSLIMPSFNAEKQMLPNWLIVSLSILIGAVFLWGIDKITPHLHPNTNKEEGIIKNHLTKHAKMFLAVTIHNIPEGLSVGIAFGVANALVDQSYFYAALFLAIGIAIQNIVEGAAVSLPFKSEVGSSLKAFWFGTLSGAVEPIAALFGFFLAYKIPSLMPWASSFAAGCMLYVIAEEMIPDLKSDEHDHIGVWSFVVGFVVMMILDTLG